MREGGNLLFWEEHLHEDDLCRSASKDLKAKIPDLQHLPLRGDTGVMVKDEASNGHEVLIFGKG